CILFPAFDPFSLLSPLRLRCGSDLVSFPSVFDIAYPSLLGIQIHPSSSLLLGRRQAETLHSRGQLHYRFLLIKVPSLLRGRILVVVDAPGRFSLHSFALDTLSYLSSQPWLADSSPPSPSLSPPWAC